ncbi:MAG TPA: hypothetical protein VLA52_14550 [Thermohalobaculum sp.]|nr:hypothetical protein [Thermohalobaculum sp.]
MTKFWLVLLIFGRISGAAMTPADEAYCEARRAIEEPRARRILVDREWNGWLVRPGDVEVACVPYRNGKQPRPGGNLRRT